MLGFRAGGTHVPAAQRHTIRSLTATVAAPAVMLAVIPAWPATAAPMPGDRAAAVAPLLGAPTVIAPFVSTTTATTAATASATGGATRTATATTPRWQRRLDRMLAGKNVGVTVRLAGSRLYGRRGRKDRIPASNQKLLMTMALFDTADPATRLRTRATAESTTTTTVRGDLWLVGSGDPSLTTGGAFGRSLMYRPTRLSRLARRIRNAGVTRITGSVKGDLSAFSRDWWAHGWRSYYPAQYAPLPSAVAFDGNVVDGRHISDPEARAARFLTRKLRALGVRVRGAPGTGVAPTTASAIAGVASQPLRSIVRHTNHRSSNFHAEMLGKYLAAADGRNSASIAAGAATVQQWAADRGVAITAHDASGLSWANRASTNDISRLLDRTPAASAVRATLARPGKGTLKGRLAGVKVRAKTGTLPGHSGLSGYVYLQRRGRWASFSILCDGMSKSAAVALENKVVQLLEARAR